MPGNPFIGPSYVLASKPASVQRTVNMIPVPLEPGNERTDWVFKDVPGLVNAATTPYVSRDDVVMLLHMDAAAPFIDQRGRTVTTVGTFPIDTADKVFGTASGVGSYVSNLSMPNSDLMDFGVNPWVFDGRHKGDVGSAAGHFCAFFSLTRNGTDIFEAISYCVYGGAIANNHRVQLTNTTALGAYTATMTWDSALDTPNPLWHHVRFGRVNSTSIAAAYDGVIVATGTILATDAFTGGIGGTTLIGSSVVGGRNNWLGHMEELVLRRGTAMDATNFTVPTSPFVYP